MEPKATTVLDEENNIACLMYSNDETTKNGLKEEETKLQDENE